MFRRSAALLLGAAVMAAGPAVAHDPGLIENLVIANRVLYDQGVVDGFGHISARDERNPEHFWLARSMAPGLVTVADVMEHDRDGGPVDARGRFLAHASGKAETDLSPWKRAISDAHP